MKQAFFVLTLASIITTSYSAQPLRSDDDEVSSAPVKSQNSIAQIDDAHRYINWWNAIDSDLRKSLLAAKMQEETFDIVKSILQRTAQTAVFSDTGATVTSVHENKAKIASATAQTASDAKQKAAHQQELATYHQARQERFAEYSLSRENVSAKRARLRKLKFLPFLKPKPGTKPKVKDAVHFLREVKKIQTEIHDPVILQGIKVAKQIVQ